MTYTPYGEFPDDEELKGFGTELKEKTMTLAPEMQAADAEQQALEQTQVEEQADSATAEDNLNKRKKNHRKKRSQGYLTLPLNLNLNSLVIQVLTQTNHLKVKRIGINGTHRLVNMS